MLRKKLSKHGNSLALVIDKPILELLGIDEDTQLEITTDGHSLRIVAEITPDERARLFAEAKEFVFTNYDEALAELAK